MKLEIDHASPIPIYKQIAAWIVERIESGELAPDRPIPSELRLMNATGASRDTVRRTVAHLRDQGLIYTVPMRGSYVTRPEDRPTQ